MCIRDSLKRRGFRVNLCIESNRSAAFIYNDERTAGAWWRRNTKDAVIDSIDNFLRKQKNEQSGKNQSDTGSQKQGAGNDQKES